MKYICLGYIERKLLRPSQTGYLLRVLSLQHSFGNKRLAETFG